MLARACSTLCLLVVACGDPGDAPIDATGADADASLGADAPAPTAAEVLWAALSTCDVIGGPYAADSGGPATIDVCALPTAVAWVADLDIDCDGQPSAACNATTDPSYLPETAATDSHGDPLDAAALPYVVLPAPSARFDYRDHGLGMRSVVAVVYADRVEYGVAGDVGPAAIIGEASYALAANLGVDPDPATGGTDGPVGYVAFTGAAAKVTTIEDHAEAVALGQALVDDLRP
ncbi:MAG: glycoside hydrolase family 75 protein [Kofleriaceae bacterium]